MEPIEALQRVVLDPSLRQTIPSLFYSYFGQHIATEQGVRHYFQQSAVIARECQAEGKDVIDVGCGFGLRSVCLALLGARKVIGVDVSREMIEGFRALRQKFPLLNLEAIEEDFVSADLADNSQDVAVLVAAISHIRDTDKLLDKVSRVLRPTGIVYILEDNNNLFLPSRLRSRRVQRTAEKQRFFGERVSILRNLCPALDDRQLMYVAERTRGLYGEQLATAAREFMATGRVTIKASFSFRDPRTGESSELGFNPLSLIKQLENSGFQCQLLPPLPLYSGIPPWLPTWQTIAFAAVRPILKRAPRIVLPFIYPTFTIIGEKEHASGIA